MSSTQTKNRSPLQLGRLPVQHWTVAEIAAMAELKAQKARQQVNVASLLPKGDQKAKEALAEWRSTSRVYKEALARLLHQINLLGDSVYEAYNSERKNRAM